jgi:tetraprenyl-beta-curcumene synthase
MRTASASWATKRARARLAAAFARAQRTYWLGIYPAARAELARWRRLAAMAPPGELQHAIATTLDREHRNAEGAALFAILAPPDARPGVTRLLVRLQSMYDLLDTLAEHPAADPLTNGRQLHTALLQALDPTAADVDPYAFHPASCDGGYLREQVRACREEVVRLPAYESFAPALQRTALLLREGQSRYHASQRGSWAPLAHWASSTLPRPGLHWWEAAASAVSTLGLHALVAGAASERATADDAAAIESAYVPWVNALNTLLDGLVDEEDDALAGTPSFFAHYDSLAQRADRIEQLARSAMRMVAELPQADRHAVLVAGMVAHYASAPQARAPAAREAVDRALAACGPIAGAGAAVLRMRRGASIGHPRRSRGDT